MTLIHLRTQAAVNGLHTLYLTSNPQPPLSTAAYAPFPLQDDPDLETESAYLDLAPPLGESEIVWGLSSIERSTATFDIEAYEAQQKRGGQIVPEDEDPMFVPRLPRKATDRVHEPGRKLW